MTACGECLVERHSMCPDLDVSDVLAADPPDDDDDFGEYEEVSYFCCCGREWSEVHETAASEYARMDAPQLKTLQWPDMEQPTEGGSP